MKFPFQLSKKQNDIVFGALVAIILVSAFLLVLFSIERQDKRAEAVETVTTPGSYGYGSYSGGAYSVGEPPSATPTP